MEWVIVAAGGRMGNKCFLPPSFISGLHPSYGAVTSARTLARIMEAERAGGQRERESGPLGWGATYVSHITPHFPASSAFLLSVYMAPFLDKMRCDKAP